MACVGNCSKDGGDSYCLSGNKCLEALPPPHWRVVIFSFDQHAYPVLKIEMPMYYKQVNRMIDIGLIRYVEKFDAHCDLKKLFAICYALDVAGDRPFPICDFFKYEADRDAFFEKYKARLDRRFLAL